MESALAGAANWNPVLQGLAGGVVIALLNLLGAMVVLVWRSPPPRFLNCALGFAAGVMISASFTSLILPGIEVGGLFPVVVGIGLGVAGLVLGDKFIPHRHFERRRAGVDPGKQRAVWLFILAITLHNMPEGLAVGVGFGSGDFSNALKLMMAIGIQNIPEGLAVSVAALQVGRSARFYASVTGIRAGLVEIPLAVLGAWAVSVASPILPYAMGFAAGAMLYVISDEIVPETHRLGRERLATYGLMLGIVVMLVLDVALA